jgi:hypothetical protein
VFRKTLLAGAFFAAAVLCPAQEASAPPKPQVKVNILNVCAPSPEEQQEIASALAHIPVKPAFSPDFEVDRGRSVLNPSDNPLIAAGNAPVASDAASADFVRIRHDFTGQSIFSTVQYSFSRDPQQMVETLVFRVRDPKDLLQSHQAGTVREILGGSGALPRRRRQSASRPERVRALVCVRVFIAGRLPQDFGSQGLDSRRTGEDGKCQAGSQASGEEISHNGS